MAHLIQACQLPDGVAFDGSLIGEMATPAETGIGKRGLRGEMGKGQGQGEQVESYVQLPSPGGPAVKGLAVPSPGFTCDVEGCLYSIKDDECMCKHKHREHAGKALQLLTFWGCKVQVLFNGISKVYFKVEESAKEPEDDMLYQALTKLATSTEDARASVIDKNHTLPALLRITGWGNFLPEVRDNKRLREAAMKLKEKSVDGKLGDLLASPEQTVDLHFEVRWKMLDDHGSKLTILKMLMHGANILSKGTMHCKLVLKSNESYPMLVLMRVIFHTLLAIMKGSFDFVMSEEQGQRLKALIQALKSEDGKLQPHKVLPHYQDFTWSIVSCGMSDQWGNILQRFIWLKVLWPYGNFYNAMCCSGVTGRRVAWLQTWRLQTPFNMITEVLQYTSTLAFCEKKDLKVLVAPDYSAFMVGTETMLLERFQDGLGATTEKIWLMYDEVVLNDRCFNMLLAHIVDDISNDSWGYYFLEELPFSER
ncbi:hypothetical protein PAXRUDRAFT_27760 [Paxillus rubicundulus Ve08.2h10]|uniref:C2H2-type domain-containing protein n=1 Tax=Paxillus rubicundulus Ve08.2h10 TaxID=930991 RepID=A0A0D0DCE6_9AGAM|nr:hypothetical protein PAXRUDRAFT_27760 [Paxillus rubicundulus Ve08.2h10]